LESIIYSDGWRGYNGLVDVGYGKHLRVDHGRDEFVRDQSHMFETNPTSTALKASGVLPRPGWSGFVAAINRPFSCT